MSIKYLRKLVRELQHARTEAEYQEPLEELARYLNITQTGESLTPEHTQEVFTQLRQLGINANRTTQLRSALSN